MVIETAPATRPRTRVDRMWLGLAVVLLLGFSLGALSLSHLPTHRVDTATHAVDLYVTAREKGDRNAMAHVLDGNAGLRANRLSEVDGRPVEVTGVTITRSTLSDTLYDVTVTWKDDLHAASTDHLLVLPRSGDPTSPPDWSVSVAP